VDNNRIEAVQHGNRTEGVNEDDLKDAIEADDGRSAMATETDSELSCKKVEIRVVKDRDMENVEVTDRMRKRVGNEEDSLRLGRKAKVCVEET